MEILKVIDYPDLRKTDSTSIDILGADPYIQLH